MGNAQAFVITLDDKHKDDKAVLAAEVEHVKQWYMVTMPVLIALSLHSLWLAPLAIFTQPFLYRLKPYRKWAEVESFKAYIKSSDDKPMALHFAAVRLSDERYNLDLSYEDALRLLR